jgi:hypothetical protein
MLGGHKPNMKGKNDRQTEERGQLSFDISRLKKPGDI